MADRRHRILLGDDTPAWVINLLDDHSRFLLAATAGPQPTTDMALDVFELAASRYGLPRQVLSDNGLAFAGRLRSFEVTFETNLADLGVELINAAPYHPQTLGKLQRFHRTIKEWLTDEGPGGTSNTSKSSWTALVQPTPAPPRHRRPNPSGALPASRRQAPRTRPQSTTPEYPTGFTKVTATGNISVNRKLIQVGYRWAGATVRVITIGDLTHIYSGETLIRALAVDPRRHYQGLKPRRPTSSQQPTQNETRR